jgi:hypothetical protein
MRFLRSPLGALVLALLLAATTGLGIVSYEVWQSGSPRRAAAGDLDFESMRVRVEAVSFPSADGALLAGWWLAGLPDRPPVILCHDFGESRASLVNLAIALRKSGFGVLLFDFRGHGASGGARSSLGLFEKRDVLGAIDYLATRPEIDARQVGLYGAGMGAHAVVLAAADRPAARVLVLDGLYPDVAWTLLRRVYHGWDFGVRHLGFVPRGVYALLNGAAPERQRAADILATLVGRDVLLLAPASDTPLAEAMQRMLESIPQQPDVDGNLVVLPVTHDGALYAEHLARYHERVSQFFAARLGDRDPAEPPVAWNDADVGEADGAGTDGERAAVLPRAESPTHR